MRYAFDGLARLLIVGSVRRRRANQERHRQQCGQVTVPDEIHNCATLRAGTNSVSTSTASSASGAPIARPIGIRTVRLKTVTASESANRSSFAAKRANASVKTNWVVPIPPGENGELPIATMNGVRARVCKSGTLI